MNSGYLNKVELKDGQILLYHRSASSKRPIYHMRIHVRGMRDIHGNKLTYWKSTTNESDLEEAKRVALDKFDELRLLAKDNRPIVEIGFADLYALWWKEKKVKLEAIFAAKGRTGQTERIGWYEKQSKRYWLAYFGNKKISEINQAYVNGYWTWRMAYWTLASEQEKKAYPNFALKPSKKTLDMEQSALREVFGWGNANKIITYQPIIQNPYARQGIAVDQFSHRHGHTGGGEVDPVAIGLVLHHLGPFLCSRLSKEGLREALFASVRGPDTDLHSVAGLGGVLLAVAFADRGHYGLPSDVFVTRTSVRLRGCEKGLDQRKYLRPRRAGMLLLSSPAPCYWPHSWCRFRRMDAAPRGAPPRTEPAPMGGNRRQTTGNGEVDD